MPMSETSKFLPLAQNDVDVVIGSREAKGAKRLDEPYYRHLMGRVFNLLVQAMLVPGIKGHSVRVQMLPASSGPGDIRQPSFVQRPERGGGAYGHGI